MKRILFFGVLLLFLASTVFAQDLHVNTHAYSTDVVKDSAGNATWTVKAKRWVASEEDIQTHKYVCASFAFKLVGAAAAYDSIDVTPYLLASLDGHNYFLVDSGSNVTGLNEDSTFISTWTLKAWNYIKVALLGWAANDSSSAATCSVWVTKQQ